MSSVRLDSVSKSYGDFAVAVRDVSLDVNEGEFVTLLGASGSGKTTCLRMVAGFVSPTKGRIFIGGKDVTHVPAHRRDTGMVFQQYALFPHLTVAENVAYGLKVRRLSRSEVERRSKEALQLVHMESLAARYPGQLSGGQKQRVALARAVVVRPQVLLLDEPLGALDLKLREELQFEIRRVQQTVGITTLFVTHDQGEALSMSDRVVIMRDGGILQADTPVRLYQRPNSRYVASFVGRMNFLNVTVESRSHNSECHVVRYGKGDSTHLLRVVGPQDRGFPERGPCVLVFRPEDAELVPSGASGGSVDNSLDAIVEKTTFTGENWIVSALGPGQEQITVYAKQEAFRPAPGEHVTITWRPQRSLLLDMD